MIKDSKTDEEILHKYKSNIRLSTNDVVRLYQIVDDPWNLGSDENYTTHRDIIKALPPDYIKHLTTVVDFGCGAGAGGAAFRDAGHTGYRIGIDLVDTRKLIEGSPHYKDALGNPSYHEFHAWDEYETCHAEHPHSYKGNTLLCFMNSCYYLFKDRQKIRNFGVKSRAEGVMTFIEKFTAPKSTLHILTIGAGRRDPFFDDVVQEDLGYGIAGSYVVSHKNPDATFSTAHHVDIYVPLDSMPTAKAE